MSLVTKRLNFYAIYFFKRKFFSEDGGRCLPAFAGRKLGEMCNRENQCDAGLVCEEVVPGRNILQILTFI